MEKHSRLLRLFFSLLLSAAVVLGLHLHIVSPYDGLMTENYILPYSWTDLLLFALFAALCFFLVGGLFRLLGRGKKGLRCDGPCLPGQLGRFFGILLLLFLLWLPYLLCYSPGFVFPDSLNALKQAMGLLPLNNRNPILYTLFLRLCLRLAGDLSGACMLYSVFQMLCMAAGFSYLICWCRARAGLGRGWILVLIVFFGLNPYVAADSVAMWKDPLFSVGLAVWSLLLTDLGLSRGEAAARRSWLVSYVLLTLVLLFWRNNGFCAVLATAAVLLVPALRRSGSGYRRALLLTVSGLLLWNVIIIPVYRNLGIGTPKEESAGLQLNQMARVAAYQGEMTEEERDFLASMLPLEAYPEAYRPCCVDLLKWDGHFDPSALAGPRFQNTWLSLGIKNPGLYFEAWELESYGFWTLTRPEINGNVGNISAGAPLNTDGDGDFAVGDDVLRFRNLLGEGWSRFLPTDFWSLPLGLLNWTVLLTALYLSVCGKKRLLPALAPSLGLALGLLAATPIWYLPRYEAGVQFLAPLFLLLLLRGRQTD